MELTYRSLTINRFLSSIGGGLFAFYIGLTLKFDYIVFVSVSSICLTILSLTFQWSLIDIVISKDSNINKSLKKFIGQLGSILLITLILFLIIYFLLFENSTILGTILGINFILYTVTNEIYNHIVIKFSLIKNPIYTNIVKAFIIINSYFFLDSSLITVCYITFLLFLINSISIHSNLKQRDINLIYNFNLLNINIFSKKNIIKANGLFLTGLTLQSTRLTSSLLDKTDLNSLLFLISDYSLITLGFIFSILYWKIGPYIKESKREILKFAKFSFVFSIFISILLEIIFRGSIIEGTLNINLFFYILSILLLTLPIVFKTYIVDLYIINSINSKFLIYSNISFVFLFVILIYLLNVQSLFEIMIIRSFLFSLLSFCLMFTHLKYIKISRN